MSDSDWIREVEATLKEGERIEIIVNIETKVNESGVRYLECTPYDGDQLICSSCKPFADAGFDVSEWGYLERHTLNYVRVIYKDGVVVRVPDGQQLPHGWVEIVKAVNKPEELSPLTVYFYDESGNEYHDMYARSVPLFQRAGYSTTWANKEGTYPFRAWVKVANGTPIKVMKRDSE